MDDALGGCIGALIVIGIVLAILYAAAMAVAYVGQTVLLVIEFIAHGFSLLGVTDPPLAWFMLGVFICGLIGLARGLGKAGRKSDIPKAYLGGALFVGILVLMSSASSNGPGTSAVAVSPGQPKQPVASPVTVTKTAVCQGQFTSNVSNCQPDQSRLHLGTRFDYYGAVPNQTAMRIEWRKDGTVLQEWPISVKHAAGYVWHNYTSQKELTPGTYEAVLFADTFERGRTRIELAPPPPQEPAPPTLPTATEVKEPTPSLPPPAVARSKGPTAVDQIAEARQLPDTQVYQIGNGVTAPVVIERVEPGYSDAARQEFISGAVRLNIEVDTNGRTRNARVVRGLGYGLDEKAIEAVNRWRFRPGSKDSKPVIVAVSVQVAFRLPSPPPDPIARFLTEAEQKIARRDYDGALADAESAVRVAPNDTRATALLERVRRIRAILK